MKKELIQKIESLMEQSKKEKIFFLLGHLPLDYFHESLSFTQWGVFSEFSLDLGLEIASHFSDKKEIEFLFLVDDKGSIEEIKAFNSTQMSRIRKKVYSQSEDYYNKFYKPAIEKFGFSDENVILQKSDKESRNNLKLHSELLMFKDSAISNICAASYSEIMKRYGDDALIVSFIPRLCQENVCMTAISMLDINPHYELINCFLETDKTSEEDILKTCLLRSSFEKGELFQK